MLKAFLTLMLLPFVQCGMLSFCREAKDCSSCAQSYTYTFGLREYCRWCVEAKQCVGPLSCPLGRAVVQRDPFRCPKKNSNAKGRRYTDALGRSLYSFILSLKHEDPGTCLHNLRPDISYIRTFTTDCDSSGNQCRGLLAVSVEAKSIYVAYRDSESQKQFAAEMLNGFGAQLGAWEKFDNSEAGVISYFHHAFYRTFIGTGMKEHFLELKKKYVNYRVWVTGYSLGGSLASMTALYLAKNDFVDKKVLRLVTFGEPRTGNVAFAEAVEKYVKFRYRVVKGDDFVASVPRSADPSTTLTGTLYQKQPLFYRYLVHYNNKMEKGDPFRICGLSDDYGCRNTHRSFSIADHLSYFHINRDKFIQDGCPRDQLF
ncbi:hypothetical protein Y032_0039g72 [Ancylostoma ceylanicum]|uniref:Fungal lipase-type domain-containing protein n=1 Tax=Ancylostoma ceylanicum TaxID=53326 RepID=A0A016UK46_9BILA|nr:hypothetical protein Y032_0039g72 [Ancylostoma ceylanicum]